MKKKNKTELANIDISLIMRKDLLSELFWYTKKPYIFGEVPYSLIEDVDTAILWPEMDRETVIPTPYMPFYIKSANG